MNPFGIWTVDHGSPTLISLALPTFVAGQMMPGRLIGLQALGGKAWGNKRLDYMLHISNGRTPLDYDLTDNKAIGARLTFTWDWNPSNIVFGASTYQGTYEDQQKVIDIAAASTPGKGYFDWNTTVAYTEHVYGLDVALTAGPLRVYAEGVLRFVYYERGKREAVFEENGAKLYAADRFEWDAYVIVAYRTPVYLEPYVMFEDSSKSYILPRFAGEARASAADRTIPAPSVGLNVHLTPQIKLKLQAQAYLAYDQITDKHVWNAYTFYSRLVASF